MAIRINLLAEAQSQEEMRRRDPVKRAVLAGVVLVGVLLAWSSSLQVKAMMARSELNRLEGQLNSRTNEYQGVLESQRKLTDANHRLAALQQLATSRLLHGSLLNALQQTTIDDVQLMRYKVEQNYLFTDEVKPKTNSNDRLVPGRPASATERIVLTLEARDSGPIPGDQVNKFKQAVADCPYFQNAPGRTNEVRLTSLSPPQKDADNKHFVLFTVECRYPERVR